MIVGLTVDRMFILLNVKGFEWAWGIRIILGPSCFGLRSNNLDLKDPFGLNEF